MKISIGSFSLSGMMFCSMLLTSSLSVAAPIKTYQVTGPVLEVTDTTITVEKDKEKWQIARDKDTKVTGDLKPGSKATIQYRMTATAIEAKGDAKAEAKAEKTEKGDKGEAKAADAKADAKAKDKDKPAKK